MDGRASPMMALASPLECSTLVSGRLLPKSHLFQGQKQPLNTAVGRSAFFGDTQLQKCFPICSTTASFQHVRRLPVVTATIKRKKDFTLDKVIEREKKLKVVTKVKNLLVKQPGKVMSLRDLGKYRRHIGVQGKRRFIVLLRKFPGVFKVFEEGCGSMYCRLTPSAEAQYKEEKELKKQLEDVLVLRLRKLLMMSVDHRILIGKIVHLRNDLGLPENFQAELVPNYPEYFEIAQTGMGPALELKKWDPELAVTYEQQKRDLMPHEDLEDITVSGRVPKFPRIDLPKGYKLPRKEKEKLLRFQQVPLISPYEDASNLRPSSREAEKRAVAVVQELLHLTVEKRTLVDHLTHFRSDFKFSQRVRGMLIRHPEIFYVSFKGQRDSVFLREAYNDNSELKEKDPLVVVKEKLARLVSISKDAMRFLQDDDDDDDESEDDGGWSDDDDVVEHDETRAFLDERRKRRELAAALKPPVEPW